MNLREWAIIFVKHKDLFEKKLEGYTEKNEKIEFSFKDKKLTTYVLEKLAVPEIIGTTWVVTLQTKENIDFLIKNWSSFASHPTLTVIFVNPVKNEKWLIKPSAHSIIADGKIGQGIHSMAEHVTLV